MSVADCFFNIMQREYILPADKIQIFQRYCGMFSENLSNDASRIFSGTVSGEESGSEEITDDRFFPQAAQICIPDLFAPFHIDPAPDFGAELPEFTLHLRRI